MRIVDVCAFYTPSGGGVKTYIERKLRAGPAAGHEIIVLAPGEQHGVRHFGRNARIVTIPAPRFPLDRSYRYFDDEAMLHDALDQLRPDMVEVSSPWSSAAMVARWRGNAPRALIMHADPLAAYAYRWFGGIARRETIDRSFDWFWRHLRLLDQQFDLIVSASRDLSRRLTEGGLGHVVTQPMGVEPGIFSPSHRSEALRAELLERCAMPRDAALLVGIGRLAPEKRWPMVIDAVAAAGYDRPIGLVLIGDGRERDKVRRAAGGNPHVQLLKPIADRAQVAAILASADALVHGCEAETFCMVAAEARASGLPLIVPNGGGAADQFVEGQGATYRATDGQALSAAIRRFIDSAHVLHRDRAARAAASTRTMDSHFDELFGLYGSLVRRSSDVA